MIPKKNEVLEHARQLFYDQAYRSGMQKVNSPEDSELLESGYIAAARSELMFSLSKKHEEYKNYNDTMENLDKTESETDKGFFDLDLALRSGYAIFGNSGCGKTNLNKIILDRLVKDGITVYVFDTSNQYEDINFNVVRVSREKQEYAWYGNTVFDLSNLASWECTSFVNTLCKGLLDRGSRSSWEFVIFEEAQLYVPNNALRSRKHCENILRLLSIGRNFCLRYGLVSQFPSYVDKFFVRNTMQRYYGWIFEPNDIRYIRQLLGKENTESLRNLRVGEFLWQVNDQIRKISVPLRKPLRESEPCFTFELKASA